MVLGDGWVEEVGLGEGIICLLFFDICFRFSVKLMEIMVCKDILGCVFCVVKMIVFFVVFR